MTNNPTQSNTPDCKHKEGPTGYIANLDWLEKKSKAYRQEKCPKCCLFKIWLPKHQKKVKQ